MDQSELRKIASSLEMIEHYMAIICRYYELKCKDEYPGQLEP